MLTFISPHSYPNCSYWVHQCSLTLTPSKSIQFYNRNRKQPGLMQDANPFKNEGKISLFSDDILLGIKRVLKHLPDYFASQSYLFDASINVSNRRPMRCRKLSVDHPDQLVHLLLQVLVFLHIRARRHCHLRQIKIN